MQLHPFTRIGNRVLIAVKIPLSPLPFPFLNQTQNAETFQGSVHSFHTDPAQFRHSFPGRKAGVGLGVPEFTQTAVDRQFRWLERKLKNAVGYFEEFSALDRQTSFHLIFKFCGSESAESRRPEMAEIVSWKQSQNLAKVEKEFFNLLRRCVPNVVPARESHPGVAVLAAFQ